MSLSEDEDSPDFETDSCVLVRDEKKSASNSLSQDLECSSPSLLGRRKRKAQKTNPNLRFENESINKKPNFQAPKMSFTPFPASPDFKRRKQNCNEPTDAGTIVNVTQGKTQSSPVNNTDNRNIETKHIDREDLDSFQWDTQMLRDVENNTEKNVQPVSQSPVSKNGYVHTSNVPNTSTTAYPANENSVKTITTPFDSGLHESDAKVVGFQTARGKSIKKPSHEALSKANLLFSDVDIVDNENSSHNLGFKTAGGSRINAPSKESLCKVRNLFEEESDLFPRPQNNILLSEFKSAAGNLMKISSTTALNRAKDLLLDQSESISTVKMDIGNKVDSLITECKNGIKPINSELIITGQEKPLKTLIGNGFTTASGNKIKSPSKASFMKVQELFLENGDSNSTAFDTELRNSKDKSTATFTENKDVPIGFVTASGGKLKAPSSVSVNKAKRIFDDIGLNATNFVSEKSTEVSLDSTVRNRWNNNDKGINFSSKEADNLNSAKKFIPFSEESYKDQNDLSSNKCTTESVPVKHNVGFTSGSGKKLNDPSSDALNKAKRVFEETSQTKASHIVKNNDTSFTPKCNSVLDKPSTKSSGLPELRKNYNTSKSSVIPTRIQNINRTDITPKSGERKIKSFKTPFKKNLALSNVSPGMRHNEYLAKSPNSNQSLTSKQCDENQHFETLKKELIQIIASGKERNKIKPIVLQVARAEENLAIKEKFKKDWSINLNNRKNNLGKLLSNKLNSKKQKTKLSSFYKRNKTFLRTHPKENCSSIQSNISSVPDSDRSSIHTFRFPIENKYRITTSDADELIQSVYIPVGQDGANIICKNDGTVGISEITSSFIRCSDVDPKLILPTPEKWIDNHYRWIFWKLASYDTKFSETLTGPILSPSTILDQIRLRYDREVEKCERSALKLIYEGDSSASLGIVLCVARIDFLTFNNKNIGQDTTLIELTDGWYSIISVLTEENPLSQFIMSKKIAVGTKLITYGAELLNMSQPCSPLEAPSYQNLIDDFINITKKEEPLEEKPLKSPAFTSNSIWTDTLNKYPMLKLPANSTRRAKWDTKLGFYHQSPTMAMPFSSLLNNGGLVSEIQVEIVRQYPLVYKKLDASKNRGSNFRPVFVNEKVFEKQQQRKRIDKNKIAEEIYMEVQKEFETNDKIYPNSASRNNIRKKRNHTYLSEKEIKELCTGEEINDAVEESPDPSAIESILTNDQCRMLQNYRQAQNDEKFAMLKTEIEKRIKERLAGYNCNGIIPDGSNESRFIDSNDVSYIPILRLRVIDLYPTYKDQKSSKTYSGTVQLWRPTEEMLRILKEGRRYRFFNTVANIIRDGEVQFRTTKMTKFSEIVSLDKLENTCQVRNTSRFHRKLTPIDDIVFNSDFDPEFREVDLIGILVQVGTRTDKRFPGLSPLLERNTNSAKKSFNTSDVQPFETIYVCDTSLNLLAIKFWKGLQEYGFENLITLEPNTCIKSPGGDTLAGTTILYFQNLQWRAFSSQEFMLKDGNSSVLLPILFVTEQTKITKNPTDDKPTKIFEEIHTEIGYSHERKRFFEQAQSRLSTLLSREKVIRSTSVNSNSRSAVAPSPIYDISHDEKTPQRTPTEVSRINTQFKVPQPSPTTPLTSRNRTRTQIRSLDYEDLLTKGNVENVAGSPAEQQSKKTSEKIRALEKASMKLSFWNP